MNVQIARLFKYTNNTQGHLSKQESWAERIEWIVANYCDGNRSRLAADIGVSTEAVSGMIRGSIPKGQSLEAIARRFPFLNPDWLLTGSGPRTRDHLPAASPSAAQAALEEIGAIVDRVRQAEADRRKNQRRVDLARRHRARGGDEGDMNGTDENP